MRTLRTFAAGLAVAVLCRAGLAQPNGALAFNVNDYVAVPPSPSIDAGITNAITIEAWVRLTATGDGVMVLQRDLMPIPFGEVYLLRINNVFPTTTVLGFYLRLGFVSHVALGFVPTSLNTWHHFAGTYDGTAMRVYWDGAQVGFLFMPGSIAAGTSDVRIGGLGGSEGWVGQLDEVRLWGLARTQAQIQSTMAAPIVGNEAGLLGYWRFDTGAGQTAVDSSPHGNSGTLGSTIFPDLNDPSWTATSAPLGVGVEAVSPPFGPSYEATAVTITGRGFFPGATTVTLGGQPLAGTVVIDSLTLLATIPPGAVGPADLSVTAPYGSATLEEAWTWADHLHATGGISAASGGTVGLSLFAGPGNALRPYLVATSLSGTSPGFSLPGTSLVLPLNPDTWTTIGLLQLDTPTFEDFFEVLDAAGTASASFNLGPIPLSPAPIGLPIHFAYVVFESFGGGFALASNAVTVGISP